MTIEQQKLDERREVLRKLACFTAPAALGKNELPQSILDNLVEHALFLQKTPTQLSKISEIIKLQFRLSFEFDEIKTSIERLLAKNLIVDNNGNYSLEVRNRAALGKTVDEKVNQENQILQKLENHIKTKEPEMSTEMIEQIKSDFRLFLTNFFLLSGAEAVQLIYGNPKAINELIGKVQKKNIFELLPARDELLKKTEQKEFCEFVNLLSEQEKLYLQDLLDRSLQYFTITVDKNCEALLTADFANWNLFVDTNFIYNLLGLNTDRYGFKRKNTEKILDLGKRAKIKFFVSPVTLDEFATSVSRARELLLGDRISRKLYRVAGEVTGNAVLLAYYEAYKQQGVSPRDFLAKTDNIKDVLKSYGIEEKTDYSQSLKDTKELSEAISKMIALTGKERYVAEHDAFHYLLILKLRQREGADNTFKTNKSWFLTHDGLLAPFDREVRKSEIPFCIRPYQLRQILRPLFSRADDFEGVFIDFITEPTARAFPAVSIDIAMNVLARVTYFEKEFDIQDSPELAIKVLTNQHFLNQLHELRSKDSEQIKSIDQEIKQVAQISDEEIEEKTQPSITTPKNHWNSVNPFWLIWQLFKYIGRLISKIWERVKRYMTEIIIGVVITVIGGIILSLIL
ncbi:MAG: hypothetical protein UV58_C0010G0015 [Candidatus Wolfebacteria bacterium GW2011_GWC1_43_10]|uniref:PIN domain-containing protein n=1 Tax=Candidatus Wolfebacteria bacterium GW2011_GWC1_43_10 TaxID=1619011 RepID=A0A0G1C9Q9_9BACT|nr:MAG: hypothetical protein UV58_C0010G0015 [Candidatus Wolfebacteria bacterium GW2011_GWC1_43_10]